ncbi:MAG TPA: D-glucuronyl C5-epimerase family protein [Gemmatimonadales bacterium]
MRSLPLLLLLAAAACASEPTAGTDADSDCAPGLERSALATLECAASAGLLTPSQLDQAAEVLLRAEAAIDSLEGPMGGADDQYYRASWIRSALGNFAAFHVRGALTDSARIARLVDVVAVNTGFATGGLPVAGERVFPSRTPHLTWVFYPSIGVYFQPVTTIENAIGIPFPDPAVATDTLLAIGNALWQYATWRSGAAGAFPVWEYDFNFLSDVQKRAPWISSLAQGEALKLYVELYRRTGDAVQAERAHQVFRSFRTFWSDGGILVDDTTHGYWWDEYDPRMWTWNGSMAALVAVGMYAETFGGDAVGIAARGQDAARYWTPSFDTGEWTTYSLLAGYVTVAYQRWHTMLAGALHDQTGDPFWSETASRWAAYEPPPGLLQPPMLPNEAARLPHIESLLDRAR